MPERRTAAHALNEWRAAVARLEALGTRVAEWAAADAAAEAAGVAYQVAFVRARDAHPGFNAQEAHDLAEQEP